MTKVPSPHFHGRHTLGSLRLLQLLSTVWIWGSAVRREVFRNTAQQMQESVTPTKQTLTACHQLKQSLITIHLKLACLRLCSIKSPPPSLQNVLIASCMCAYVTPGCADTLNDMCASWILQGPLRQIEMSSSSEVPKWKPTSALRIEQCLSEPVVY